MTMPPRILTRRHLRELIPYTPQHIQRLEKAGKFPRRIQLGPNRVGWVATEVDAWLAERIAQRDAQAKAA
ncbi:MAG: AlpA family phage regulatory protein [Hyphomicrobium sp.]